MPKPDRELEELEQRFAEVEKTIQSACEIMEKLREASPKIEMIHKMLSEIHEIKNKTMQEIKPVKDRLEGLVDSHSKTNKSLEGLRRELWETREQTKTELAQHASLARIRQLENKLEEISSNLSKSFSEQNEKFCSSVSKLSDTLEKQEDYIKSIVLEVSKNGKNVKIALFIGAGALFLSAVSLFLNR